MREEITDVCFLTPARIRIKASHGVRDEMVAVDFVNRKVYRDDQEYRSEEVFDYLDQINSIPENFYEAPQEVYQQVLDAQQDHDTIREQNV